MSAGPPSICRVKIKWGGSAVDGYGPDLREFLRARGSVRSRVSSCAVMISGAHSSPCKHADDHPITRKNKTARTGDPRFKRARGLISFGIHAIVGRAER